MCIIEKSKKMYEEYLNVNSPEHGSDKWFIGWTIRIDYMLEKKYGTALRRHDPIAFEVGYNDWYRD